MYKFPQIEVSFLIEGKDFDLEHFTKEIGVTPSKTRGIGDWPKAIVNNTNLPEELKPRCEWSLCHMEESCRKVEKAVCVIISKLKGKEQKIIDICEAQRLKKALSIVIHAEAINMPEIVLTRDIVSYFGDMKADFIKTLEKSIRVTPEMLKANMFKRLFRSVVRIFAPLM